jgi:hypothetical protein
MDIVSIFALIILLISIGTLMIGVAAYIAFKVRSARGPKPIIHGHEHPVDELMFLKPYVPEQLSIASPLLVNPTPLDLLTSETNIQQNQYVVMQSNLEVSSK